MIDVLNESTINNVISTLNNIVYQSSNQTTQEIDSHLRSKLKSCFVNFFGEQHKDSGATAEITRVFVVL